MTSKGKEAGHDNRVMIVNECAKYFRVHNTTIYRLAKRGEIPAFKVGKEWRFSLNEIERWLVRKEYGNAPLPEVLMRGNPGIECRQVKIGNDAEEMGDIYKTNLSRWAGKQARALRERRLDAIDWENLIREINRLKRK